MNPQIRLVFVNSKLDTVQRSKPLKVSLPNSPSSQAVTKMAQLVALRPDLAASIERVIDRLLADPD